MSEEKKPNWPTRAQIMAHMYGVPKNQARRMIDRSAAGLQQYAALHAPLMTAAELAKMLQGGALKTNYFTTKPFAGMGLRVR